MVYLKSAFCVAGGVVAYWLGGVDTLLICLTALIILDYATGVLSAIYNKELDSEIGFKGIIKKVIIYMVVALSFVIETFTSSAFPLREIVISFFICNEAISMLENVGKTGIEYPQKLKDILQQLKGKKGD